MVGLLHNASLYLVLPLLETLGCRRVGERTFEKEGLWDPSLDAISFLEKTLLPADTG